MERGERISKILWVKWSAICKHQKIGGIGVKDLHLICKLNGNMDS